MCELFGLSGKEKVRPEEMLKEFFSHGKDNPHGWGTAVFRGGKAKVTRETASAAESGLAVKIAETGCWADLLMAHIRFATKGQISIENTHPFVMKDSTGIEWVFMHNGTMFESGALSGYVHSQRGETDSERIMMYLIDCMDRAAGANMNAAGADMNAAGENANASAAALTTDKKISTVERVIKEITPENKINILLSDGRFLYAHTNFRGSLHYIRREGLTVISSRPLVTGLSGTFCRSAEDGVNACGGNAGTADQVPEWEEVPLNTLMVFEKGQLIYRGLPHDNEYIEDEEKTRALFLDYASM